MKRLMIYSKRKLPDISSGRDFFKKNGVMIFLCIIFLCGLITGISVYFGADRERELITLFTQRYVARSTVSFYVNELIVTSVLMIIAALAGVSAAGLPFIAAVPFVKGMLNGVLSAYLIGTFSAVGYGYYALMTVPGGCLCVLAIVHLCEMCCSVSGKVFKTSFADSREGINGARYLIICGICVLGGALSCTVDLIMRLIFGGVFKLI